jgi:uncharacterized protein (DUF1800 family)
MQSDTRSFTAAHRFGLGPRPGELAIIARDPSQYLLAQLRQTPIIPRELADYPNSAQRVSTIIQDLIQKTELKKALRDSGQTIPSVKTPQMMKSFFKQAEEYRDESASRIQAAINSKTPFVERLVHFWSNHFTVSITKNEIRPLVGSFEREAIRPHVLGRFEDMLIASTRHPAMLGYLDQSDSIGPNSMVGLFGHRGLNENLAREILELHTLGVNGGYQQQDVIAFAKILTGWSVGGVRSVIRILAKVQATNDMNPDDVGRFDFIEMMHEPGDKQFMGQIIREQGVEEGIKILKYLAAHPSTARFIATKLARHFVSDNPPASVIDRLAQVFLKTGGNLAMMAQALVVFPEVWQTPLSKIKTPTDYLIALVRAADAQVDGKDLMKELEALGQLPFSAPSPAGWRDDADAWIGVEALLRRIELAQKAAQTLSKLVDPRQFLQQVLGPMASEETILWVSRAPDAVEGVAMVLASSEFQRR